ncbi:MAG TPA: hypothetical protein PKA50_15145 [Gemmatimonadales bacterium]|nr:hypothetical protein [Gemmatimonadales bacterium]
MAADLPARIDRAAIERIIQRATELQTGERDIGEGMSPDEVVSLGKDVGIPERYLRQAILEEHGRVELPAPHGLLDRVFGAATVSAQRVVAGTPEEVGQRLGQYLEREEVLTVQRELPGRITWEPLRGIEAALRRSTAAFGGRKALMLSKAQLVTATITALEPGFCHVSLTTDLGSTRQSLVIGVAVSGVVGAGAAVVLGVLSPLVWLPAAPLLLAAGIGYAVKAQYRPAAERALLGVERALDHLERGQAKPGHQLAPGAPGLLGAIIEEIRKATKP